MDKFIRIAALFTAGLAVLGAAECFLVPGLIAARDIRDDAMGAPGIPQRALDLHRNLSDRIAPWARERVASGEATRVPLYDVPQTEWPIFTCVFYLNATQQLADQGVDVSYASESIEAARDLIMDPGHHTWVRTHWGDDYLHDENVFFRSLLISGLTSYEVLTENGRDLEFLRDQAETLAADLDRSPHGVLQDYPNETYPIDVLASIAWIRRADRVLGTDHSEFVQRARRAFVAPYDDELGLPRFRVDLQGNSMPINVQPGRGIGTSWILIFAPELWPQDAERWYAVHEAEFWQEVEWATGFREYTRDHYEGEWTYDVDAGPVLDGFGTAASAFGVGAARRNGRFDHAYTLSAQMSSSAWPWLDGSLLLPQEFSHSCAPMLGEAAIAYFLTVQPAEGVKIVQGGHLTPLVWFGFSVYFGAFALILWIAILAARRVWRVDPMVRPIRMGFSAFLSACGVLSSFADPFVGVACLVVALLMIPKRRRTYPLPKPPALALADAA